MTAGRVNRWRLPLLLVAACLVLGGLLAWQLIAPSPLMSSTPPRARDEPAARREAGDADAANADGADADGAGTGAAPDAEAEPGEAAASDAFSLPPLTTFSGVVERPLFTRNRRPAPAAAEASATAATSEGKSPFLLSGVMIVGTRRVALLQSRASPRTIRVEEGETIEGWKVTAIRPQVVTVVSGTNKDDLKLPDRIGTPTAVPGAPRQPGRGPAADQTRPPGAPPMPPGRPTEQPPGDVEPEQQ